MKNGIFGAFCIVFSGFLAGCTSPGVSTIDDLTISSSNDGQIARPVNMNYPLQTRFLSVNGLLPVPGPGSACLASSFRVANAIICFSSDNTTHVLEKEFPAPDDALTQMAALKARLANLEVAVVQLVAAELANDRSITPQLARTITQESANIALEAQNANLLVFRWVDSAGGNANGGIGSLFSARGAASRSQSGVVIVGGLRVSQLMVGQSDFDRQFGTMPSGAKVATLTMAADHLLYFTNANLSAALDASLDGNLEELSTRLSPETQIALRAYAQIGRAQENQGLFTAPTIQRRSLQEVLVTGAQGQVFYATMTDVATLQEALASR